jgi:hypothetical protein
MMNEILQLNDEDSKTSFVLADIVQSCSACVYTYVHP